MEGVVQHSRLLYVGFSDHESVTVRWYKSEVIDSLASVEPGTELTVLVHPKSDYAMSIQSEDKIICDFNNTLQMMESERKGFLYLVAGIYSLFLVVVIWTILEYGRKKRKRQTAEKNRKYCQMSLDKISQMCFDEFTLDFEIKNNGKTFHIGSYAETDSEFKLLFERGYYIGSNKYISFEEFKEKLQNIAPFDRLSVIAIEDEVAEEYLASYKAKGNWQNRKPYNRMVDANDAEAVDKFVRNNYHTSSLFDREKTDFDAKKYLSDYDSINKMSDKPTDQKHYDQKVK